MLHRAACFVGIILWSCGFLTACAPAAPTAFPVATATAAPAPTVIPTALPSPTAAPSSHSARMPSMPDFDVLIIGGVTGGGTALDLALRWLRGRHTGSQTRPRGPIPGG